jgi:hypothetical protein
VDRHEFEIRIDKDGRVHVEIKGSQGQRCLALADMLREIVGTEEKRTLTSEYYGPDGKVRINVKAQQRRPG